MNVEKTYLNEKYSKNPKGNSVRSASSNLDDENINKKNTKKYVLVLLAVIVFALLIGFGSVYLIPNEADEIPNIADEEMAREVENIDQEIEEIERQLRQLESSN